MQLPTALIVGPMKAGTTWIHEYLAFRGDVCLPMGTKETFYFDRYFKKGSAWYARHFTHFRSETHRIIVEVAPSLFHCTDAPQRVAEVIGQIPLLVTTRDPVMRSWSHYLHLRRYGQTRKPLRDAARDYPEIITASRYEEGIARWACALPGSAVHQLRLELLSSDHEKYIGSLCTTLGLGFQATPPHLLAPRNSGASAPSYLVARAARAVSSTVRRAGLYGALQKARDLGLRDLAFGSPTDKGERQNLSDADAAWLEDVIGVTRRKVEATP